MRSFLATSSSDSHLSENLRHLSSSLTNQSTAPYESLKRIWHDPICRLSSPVPISSSPKERGAVGEIEEAERKAYDELVKDITPRKPVAEPFSSYKDQLGFAFRALFSKSPPMSAAGGILGLVGAMLVETLLFILRSSNLGAEPSSKSSRPSNLKIKKNQ